MNAEASFIAVAEFDNEREATIAAGMLQNNGIDARVDASIMTTLYGAGATWAPVRLLVPEAMAAEASELLKNCKD